jgi:hypothetical protein
MKILDFFLFLPSWIQIWIRNLNADPDPDPATQINADPDLDTDPDPKPCSRLLHIFEIGAKFRFF